MRCAFLLAAAATAVAAAQAAAQDEPPVEYRVTFENAAHHEARISMTLRGAQGPVAFRMSRSSPGRYAIHEFAKNVYDVSAEGPNGEPLMIVRDDPYSWDVPEHDGEITLTYTLFADRADGTYSAIDLTHAHLNMPATFMWADGYEDRPIEVRFEPASQDWKAATQLAPTPEPMRFTAPDLQYFMDSPTELSDFELHEWTVLDGNETRTIRLALHHDGSAEDGARFAEMAKNVVAAQIELWGDVPDFDYGTYTFIADYLPHVAGDGMEHRNSTILSNPRSLADAEFSQLGTLSHEFMHAWNVERLRPAELEPFDFNRANPTPSLWFAEGVTNYYTPLMILRAGEMDRARYFKDVESALEYVLNRPGMRFEGPMGMSLRAPFVDAATSIDPTNYANTFTSYYVYGEVLGLALDLTLRSRFEDVGLDDYMRLLWRRHGVDEVPYATDDLEDVLTELTGDAAFAQDFFARHIRSNESPDFAALLDQAGLILRPANPDAPHAGLRLLDAENGAEVAAPTLIGSPAYAAGLDRGDVITAADFEPVASARALEDRIAAAAPGETLALDWIHRGLERSGALVIGADPALELVTYEEAGRELDARRAAFRDAWLNGE